MNTNNTTATGKYAASLTLVEIGLGSLLHSLKIPLVGHFLSLNQIAILSRSSFHLKSKKSALEISAIASLLKSLSPAGKKLTPMLAIAAQGVFFYFGLMIGGLNPFGLITGAVLSSLWAFVQPVLFIYLLFGKTSLEVAAYFLKEIEKIIPNAEQFLLIAVLALLIIKCLLAAIVSIVAIKIKEETFGKYQQKMIFNISESSFPSGEKAWKLALRDLCNPLFLVSLALTAFFFLFSQSEKSTVIWSLLRPVALGYLIFFMIRMMPVEKMSAWLRKKGFEKFAANLDEAFSLIKRKN